MSPCELLRAKIRAAASLSRDGWAVSDLSGHPMWANDIGWTRDRDRSGLIQPSYEWAQSFWHNSISHQQSDLTKYWADRHWTPNDPKSALELLAEQLAE